MNPPLVSICIPAYNVGNYIEATVRSVLDQTYNNIEIIIVDDGSNDNTREVIEKKFKNNQIKLYIQENKGASSARNLAYDRSSGQYIKFLDGDDLISPGMIESQLKLAEENRDCTISGKWGRFYDDDINTFKLNKEECWQTMPPAKWLCASWKKGKSMTQSGIFLIPRSIVEKAGPWDEHLSLIDDLDFFTRIILNSERVVFDEKALLYYRSGIRGSLSTSQSDRAIQSAFTSINQATTNLLKADSGKEAAEAAANVWQSFIYNYYPKYPQYLAMAKKKVWDLNGSTLDFPCGGTTKKMVRLFGWRLIKRLKKFVQIYN